jgi:hypothetical protein
MASNSNLIVRGWLPAAALALGVMLAPATGHAFTLENGDGTGGAKFDLEEQMSQFRTRDLNSLSPSSRDLQTPIGKMQFDVRQGSAFGSPFGSSFGSSSRAVDDRRHYERMFDPAYLLPR